MYNSLVVDFSSRSDPTRGHLLKEGSTLGRLGDCRLAVNDFRGAPRIQKTNEGRGSSNRAERLVEARSRSGTRR